MSKTFGDNLKRIRKSRGLPQSALIKGKSQSFISKVESGKHLPSQEYIDYMCDILNCTQDDLFTQEATHIELSELKSMLLKLQSQIKSLTKEVRNLSK